jgi:hypothetical protein
MTADGRPLRDSLEDYLALRTLARPWPGSL